MLECGFDYLIFKLKVVQSVYAPFSSIVFNSMAVIEEIIEEPVASNGIVF